MNSEQNEKPDFFTRWSRRKLQQSSPAFSRSDSKDESKQAHARPEKKKNDRADKPVWQQDGAEEQVKQAAMAALFRQAEFQDVDHLNEYDEYYTSFSPLGDIVTHEMKRMWKLAEEKIQSETATKHAEENSAPRSEKGGTTSA